MDIISLIYFSIATVATFVFNQSIFIEKSGFLGYFALFLMAIFSLIIKRPYTLQVSKKDYPEIYWKNKIFLLINTVVTAVWALIFAVNAMMFLKLSSTVTLIFSNILIALGIIFSIVFPPKAPDYFDTKAARQCDWNVKVELEKPKGEDEYDVVIVGSGIGGLTCVALLSKRGYKVLVLEQCYLVGGYCSSFKRRGFVFNSGVESVSGLWEKGPLTYLLASLALKRMHSS